MYSVDFFKGQFVNLWKGERCNYKVLSENPKDFLDKIITTEDELHIVNLNGAFQLNKENLIPNAKFQSLFDYLKIIKQNNPEIQIQIGGGIRDEKTAREFLDVGFKIVIGTLLFENEGLIQTLKAEYGNDKIILALDIKSIDRPIVLSHGWTQNNKENFDIYDIIEYLNGIDDNMASDLLVTVKEYDGTKPCADNKRNQLKFYKNLNKIATKSNIIASGGIDNDLANDLKAENIKYVQGRVLLENSLSELFASKLDYSISSHGLCDLIPVIAVNTYGKILMQAFAKQEQIIKTIDTGIATYFSRSRNQEWVKGETSGHKQVIKKVITDCDSDSVIYVINQQRGINCHVGNESCFDTIHYETNFFRKLESLIRVRDFQRKQNVGGKSYTKELLGDETLNKRKIIEEASEVILSDNQENLTHECADLLYHTLTFAIKKGISIEDIQKELQRRNKQ